MATLYLKMIRVWDLLDRPKCFRLEGDRNSLLWANMKSAWHIWWLQHLDKLQIVSCGCYFMLARLREDWLTAWLLMQPPSSTAACGHTFAWRSHQGEEPEQRCWVSPVSLVQVPSPLAVGSDVPACSPKGQLPCPSSLCPPGKSSEGSSNASGWLETCSPLHTRVTDGNVLFSLRSRLLRRPPLACRLTWEVWGCGAFPLLRMCVCEQSVFLPTLPLLPGLAWWEKGSERAKQMGKSGGRKENGTWAPRGVAHLGGGAIWHCPALFWSNSRFQGLQMWRDSLPFCMISCTVTPLLFSA